MNAGSFLSLLAPCAVLLLPSMASAQNFEYTVTDLGVPPGALGAVMPDRINNLGEVVGWAPYSSPVFRAFVWTPAEGITVLPQPPGLTNYRATDISDTGIISGDGGEWGAEGWRYDNGAYDFIGILPGDIISEAEGINDAGDIAGTSLDVQLITPNNAVLAVHGGGLVDIVPNVGMLGMDINNAGTITGYTDALEAFRWTAEGGLEILGPVGFYAYTFGFAINDLGQVVGKAKTLTGNAAIPFICTPDGVMQEIPGYGGQSQEARGINDDGHVVGWSNAPIGLVAWIWTPKQGTRLLHDLIDPAEHLVLNYAWDINDAGQVVARGHDIVTGQNRAVILTPVVEAIPGDLNNDGTVNFADVLLVIAAWGPCSGACPADLDGSGDVGFGDVLAVIANWS